MTMVHIVWSDADSDRQLKYFNCFRFLRYAPEDVSEWVPEHKGCEDNDFVWRWSQLQESTSFSQWGWFCLRAKTDLNDSMIQALIRLCYFFILLTVITMESGLQDSGSTVYSVQFISWFRWCWMNTCVSWSVLQSEWQAFRPLHLNADLADRVTKKLIDKLQVLKQCTLQDMTLALQDRADCDLTKIHDLEVWLVGLGF